MDNPYSPPTTQFSDIVHAEAVPESIGTIARRTFITWEKLRLLYVAILGGVTILLSLLDVGNLLFSPRFWVTVVEGAIVANLCFFAGPTIDTYATWLGLRGHGLRVVLFVLGTILSCLLALAAVATLALPGMA